MVEGRNCVLRISPHKLHNKFRVLFPYIEDTTATIKTCSILSAHFFLQHDNTQPHASAVTIVAIERLGFHIILRHPYSLDLAPSDYYLSHHLKKHLKGQCYSLDDELKAAVSCFLRSPLLEFYGTGIRKLILCWWPCIKLDGDLLK